jgi:hypothetical protein
MTVWPEKKPLTPYELKLRQVFVSRDYEQGEFADWDDSSFDKADLVDRLKETA